MAAAATDELPQEEELKASRHLEVGLSSLLILPGSGSYRYAQRCVSSVVLSAVKSTYKINNCRRAGTL